jgi:PAS domain S-box-containing protein
MTVSKIAGTLPLVTFGVLLILLSKREPAMVSEVPLLFASLNTLFLCFIPLTLAYFAAQSHQATGSGSFLMLGSGLVFFGYSSLLAGWMMPLAGEPNPMVTLRNLGYLFAAFCHVAGARLVLQEILGVKRKDSRHNSALVYGAIVVAVSLIALAAFQGRLPLFFNQSTGPTALRQTVLGGAICLFAIAGYLFLEIHSATKTGFTFWYGQALCLIAAGLVCLFCEDKVGGALGWAGRAAQYLASCYFLLACRSGRRDCGRLDGEALPKAGPVLWPYLEHRISERTSELAGLNDSLRREIQERKEARDSLTGLMLEQNIILENIPFGFLKAVDRQLVLVNGRAEEMFQYTKEELLYKSSRQLYPSDEAYQIIATQALPVLALGQVFEAEQELVRKDGIRIQVRYIGKAIDHRDISRGVIWLLEDVTKRRQAERYGEMGREVLQKLNEPGDLQHLIRDLLSLLKTRTGIDAVGIRLQQGDDYPYFAQEGFSPDFLLRENTLTVSDGDGSVCRNEDGCVNLVCTCGLVIAGKTATADTFMTDGGSFWTNDSFQFLNLAPGDDPRIHPRNECVYSHYASQALIPLRNEDKIIGLIQFNDRQKGRFTLDVVEILEGIASHVGSALVRKQSEAALLQKEADLRKAQIIARTGSWTLASDGTFSWSDELYRLYGVTPESFAPSVDSFIGLIHQEDRSAMRSWIDACWLGDSPEELEFRALWPGGSIRFLCARGELVHDTDGRPPYLSGTAQDITGRKEIQQALVASQANYRTLFESASDGIVVADATGRYLDVNTAACRMVGYTREELMSRNFFESFAPQEIARLAAFTPNLVAGEVSKGEWLFCRKAGDFFICDLSATLLADGRMLGTLRDVTERKRVEEALQKSEERFSRAIQATKDGLWEWDLLTDEVFFSARFCEIIGYAFDDPQFPHTSKAWFDRIHDDDYQRVVVAMMDHLETHSGYDVEYRHLHKSGEYRWQSSQAETIFNEMGRAAKLVGCISDITKRKTAEEELRKSEERYRGLVEQMRDGLTCTDEAHNVTFANGRFFEIVGLPAEEVIGKSIYTLFDQLQKGILFEQLQARESGKTSSYDLEISRDDGSTSYLAVSGSPFFNQDGQFAGSIGVVTDLTDRIAAEKELRKSHERLRQLSAHLESTRENERLRISREVHDELGQSLTALKLGLNSLRKNRDFPATLIPRFLALDEAINATIGSVQRITADLRPRCLDELGLEAAIQWQADDFSNRTGIDCRLRLCEAPQLSSECQIAVIRIMQESLTNILRHAQASAIAIALEHDLDGLRFTIADNGRGITDQQQAARNSFGLMGMHERASLCGGTFDIETTIGRGTAISVWLPLNEVKEE